MARGINIKFGAQPYNLQASSGRLWVAVAPISMASTAPVAPFDFYISPTGSNTSAGTLASPWAFSSLLGVNQPNYNSTIAANRAKMAGQRIGVLPGTYNLQTLAGTSGVAPVGDFSTPQFQVPPGTSSANRTVVQSTVPFGAILDGGWGSSTTQNPAGVPLFGTLMSGASTKYITIDGFEVRGGSGHLMMVGGDSDISTSVHVPGITVKNMYLHNTLDNSQGANSSAITIYTCSGGVFQNIYVTNIINTFNRNSGIEAWNCIDCSLTNSTVIMGQFAGAGANPGGGIVLKNTGHKRWVVAYCYVDNTACGPNASAAYNVDLSGTAADTSSFHNNVAVSQATMFGVGVGGVNNTAIAENYQLYNNTWNTPTGNVQVYGSGAILTQYNSIFARTGNAGGRGDSECNAANPALHDYNMYKSYALGLAANGSVGFPATLTTSQAAWAAAVPSGCVGKDAHSLVGAPTYVGGTPAFPADFYKLAGGSLGTGAGRNNGQISGAVCDMGAWGNLPTGVTQIGCDHAHTANV